MGETVRKAVAAIIKQPNSKISLVSKDGLWTLLTGKLEPGEDYIGALFREMYEELGIEKSELMLVDCLGPDLRRKDNNPENPLTNFEIVFCKVSAEVAKRIRYKEGDENTLVWLEPQKAWRLDNLDGLANEAIKRYLARYFYRTRRVQHERGETLQRRVANCEF